MTWSLTGGARGAAQLRQVLQGLHMHPMRARVEAVLTEADVDSRRQLVDPDRTFGPVCADVRAVDRELTDLLVPGAANAAR